MAKSGLEAELESIRDIVRAYKRLDTDRARIRATEFAWAVVTDEASADVSVIVTRGSGVVYGKAKERA